MEVKVFDGENALCFLQHLLDLQLCFVKLAFDRCCQSKALLKQLECFFKRKVVFLQAFGDLFQLLQGLDNLQLGVTSSTCERILPACRRVSICFPGESEAALRNGIFSPKRKVRE